MGEKSIANEDSGGEQYLGIDVGGSYVKWGLIQRNGNIIISDLEPTPYDNGIEGFYQTIERIISKADEHGKISGIGICTAGIVDNRNGIVLGGIENIPYLNKAHLKKTISERSKIPVSVLNDVKAVAIGEQWIRGTEADKTLFYMTIGTGIGGCLLIHGSVYEGAHYRSCEIGYMDYGCGEDFFEKKCSGKALISTARAVLKNENLSEDEFFAKIRKRDPKVFRVYEEWIDQIALRIANIILIADPEVVVIGGGITERKELLLEPMRTAVERHLPEDFKNITQIELAVCGNKAGMLGAVKNFMNGMEMRNKSNEF